MKEEILKCLRLAADFQAALEFTAKNVREIIGSRRRVKITLRDGREFYGFGTSRLEAFRDATWKGQLETCSRGRRAA